MHEEVGADATTGTEPEIWARTPASPRSYIHRPPAPPRAESVEEIAAWAGSEDSRRVELVFAPVFWVVLPLLALGFLIHQSIVDPTGAHVSITVNGESRDSWPAWVPWAAWGGVGIWLLVSVGVLLLRLSILWDLHAENERIFTTGVAHSLHRSSTDFDDGEESGWATYIALDHRLDDRSALRIHTAFEQWLAQGGQPPSGSGPISSATLFGAAAAGGYYILHLPISQTAGSTVEQQWILITPADDADDDVIVTPVPVPKKRARIRRALQRKANAATRRGA